MKAILKGRIKNTKFLNGSHYTIIDEPAVDEWSKPSAFKVQSDNSLGNPGDIVQLNVVASGYVKENKYNDKKTGEPKVYEDPTVYLSAQLATK